MKPRGFTLLELLVVVAIIGLLAALTVVSLNSSRVKSRDSSRLATMRQVQNALELYYGEHTSYPSAAFPTDLVTALKPYLVPAYIPAISYDMTNISGPTYYSPAGTPNSYLMYISTERQWGSAYGCRTGVGAVVNSGLYSTVPVCN